MARFFKKVSFWNKVERTLSLLAGISLVEMGLQHVDYKWIVTLGIIGIVAKLIHVWIEDINGDGIVDGLENDNK